MGNILKSKKRCHQNEIIPSPKTNIYEAKPRETSFPGIEPPNFEETAEKSFHDIEYKYEKITFGSIIGKSMYCHHEFERRDATELSISRGEEIKIIEDKNENFVRAKRLSKSKEQGKVYKSFICPLWYHGNLTRTDAKIQLLSEKNEPGAYLVRDSDRALGYALSVKIKDRGSFAATHFKIKKDESVYIQSAFKFDDVALLIKYYTDNPVTRELCLSHPCHRSEEKFDLSTETKKDWEIPHEHITLTRVIGSGKFGDVHYGFWHGHTAVAVKTMKKNAMEVSAFLEEAKIMKELQHKNILPLYAVCTSKEPFYIVFEYMDKGCLLDLLKKNDRLISTFQDYIVVIYQITLGMYYLEEKPLVHRDLAARNILVNKNRFVKIADFGLARNLNAVDDIYSPSMQGKFPVKWTAPEVLGYRAYTSKSDVWSFGIVLTEIFNHGQIPYKEWGNTETMEKVIQGYRMAKPGACPNDIYKDVLQKCWDSNPQDRPTFHYLFDYFSTYSLDDNRSYLSVDQIN